MSRDNFDVLIVGSGAGGATLANELTGSGRRVMVLERGRYHKSLGTFGASMGYYDGNRVTKVPLRSKEGITIWRALMAGGSTVVSCGSGVVAMVNELRALDVNLADELKGLQEELNIRPMDRSLLSEGSIRIEKAAADLGYDMELMPKFIDFSRCRKCSFCVLGCQHGAKWSAADLMLSAVDKGARIMYRTEVERVIIEGGRAVGVVAKGPGGRLELFADKVVVSAGGIGTPVILKRSGIEEAGHNFYMDIFVNVYGNSDGPDQLHEPTMSMMCTKFHKEGYILSPFIHANRVIRIMETGSRGLTLSAKGLMGIMVKISDDPCGSIDERGTINKWVTDNDQKKLDRGIEKAKEILIRAGVKESSLVVSKPQGAHPGGTAAIGKVVDKNLRTGVKGLYVCDCSVIPSSPGLPPILTICALARRLAKHLA